MTAYTAGITHPIRETTWSR